MRFKKLEEKRKRFIEILRKQSLEKEQRKVKETVQEIGISLKTFYEWNNDPEILKETYREYFESIEVWLPKVLFNLLKKADEGDVGALRFLIKGFTIYSEGIEKRDGLENDRMIEMVRGKIKPQGAQTRRARTQR